jgi:hypothetical protein
MIIANQEYSIIELTPHGMPTEVYDWMHKQYGPPESGRWFYRHPSIYFANPKDHLMFTLRWS